MFDVSFVVSRLTTSGKKTKRIQNEELKLKCFEIVWASVACHII